MVNGSFWDLIKAYLQWIGCGCLVLIVLAIILFTYLFSQMPSSPEEVREQMMRALETVEPCRATNPQGWALIEIEKDEAGNPIACVYQAPDRGERHKTEPEKSVRQRRD